MNKKEVLALAKEARGDRLGNDVFQMEEAISDVAYYLNVVSKKLEYLEKEIADKNSAIEEIINALEANND